MTFSDSPLESTIVDSFPYRVGPQSMYRSTLSPSWARASSHVTGEGPPWRFALVVVMGPNAFVIAWATVWSGTRTPKSPGADTNGTGASLVARSRIVIGPGICFAMTLWATGVTWAYFGIWSGVVRANATGCSAGRRFTSNTRSTAGTSNGSHPRPYSVSVGYTISLPASRVSQTASYSSRDRAQCPAFIRPLIVRIGFGRPSGGPDLTIWRRASRHRRGPSLQKGAGGRRSSDPSETADSPRPRTASSLDRGPSGIRFERCSRSP